MINKKSKMRAISYVIVFIILHSSFIISEAQRSKEIYIQVIDTAGLTASVVADTSWILGQLDIVRAELADTSEAIQSIIDQQRRLYFAPYYLGQDTLGGIIYHLELDANGEVHGLIACPFMDYDSTWTGVRYRYNPKYNLTSTLSTLDKNLYDGAANTDAMVALNPSSYFAAKYCYDLVYGGQSDWYMPSLIEMQLLSQNMRYVINADASVNWFIYESNGAVSYEYYYNTSSFSAGSSTYAVELINQITTGVPVSEKVFVIPIRKF